MLNVFNFTTLTALVSVPGLALANAMIVSDPTLCNTSPEAVWDAGGFTMSGGTVEAIEFICEFDPLPVRDAMKSNIVTSKGYCAGPMFLIPQVFAFDFGKNEGGIEMIGQFAQYVPSGRISFFVCEE